MLTPKAFEVNDKKVVCDINVLNKNLFKSKNIKKIFKNLKFGTKFLNSNSNSILFKLISLYKT